MSFLAVDKFMPNFWPECPGHYDGWMCCLPGGKMCFLAENGYSPGNGFANKENTKK